MEGPETVLGPLAELAVLERPDRMIGAYETTLEIADRLAAVPPPQREVPRNSENSPSRADLLLAPTMRRTASPLEKTIIVGMLITW